MMTDSTGRQARARMVLGELWRAYEEIAAQRDAACAAGCSACCTDRVLLTGLEAQLLAEELIAAGQEPLLAKARVSPAGASPACTHNALARLYLTGQEPPEEPEAAGAGSCPLLLDDRCAAYGARPFVCRVMTSQSRCQPGGSASQDPWWITVDTVFLQVVEQISAGRVWGALPRVLASLDGDAAEGLCVCENLPGLPVPPQHQERLNRLLPQLFSRPLNGQPLGWWINQLRV